MINSELIQRNQKADHLITPLNSGLIVIDFQPNSILTVNTIEKSSLISNAVSIAKLARIHKIPAFVTTAGVTTTGQKETIPGIMTELYGTETFDRTNMNAWENERFSKAVREAGRKKLIFIGVWSEVCVTLPALDALKEGYEVYLVADAIAGVSPVSHRAAMQRMIQAGAVMTSVIQLACELQRDWERDETAGATLGLLRDYGIFLRLD